MDKWYGEDLAHVHDEGFREFALSAAPGILAILRENGIRDGLVVDLGCGSGIWARELTEAGYDVLGIDVSGAMVEIARRKVPGAVFRVASLFEAELLRCVAVTSIGEVLNYLFDPNNDETALAGLFRRVYDVLVPGGVFVFDLLEPGQIVPNAPTRSFIEGEDWVVLVEKEEDPARKTLTRRISTFRKTGDRYRRSDETHRVRLYRAPDVAAELRRAGFEVRTARGYGRYPLSEAHVAFVARKPA